MGIFKLEFSVVLFVLWVALIFSFINARRKKIKKFENKDKIFHIKSKLGNVIYAIVLATVVIVVPSILLY
ncbi:MAG: hypothetical protein ACRCWG_02885 [Sarcina sp.]